MSELIEVLKEERKRQTDWFKSRGKAVNKWISKNG
jgi:hypothetical protein